MQSIHSIEQLLYTNETPESVQSLLQQQITNALYSIRIQEKELACIQQFTEKTPISVLITCLKPQESDWSEVYLPNPQSFPLLNTSILSNLTQTLHQRILSFSDLLYRKLMNHESSEILLLYVILVFYLSIVFEIVDL